MAARSWWLTSRSSTATLESCTTRGRRLTTLTRYRRPLRCTPAWPRRALRYSTAACPSRTAQHPRCRTLTASCSPSCSGAWRTRSSSTARWASGARRPAWSLPPWCTRTRRGRWRLHARCPRCWTTRTTRAAWPATSRRACRRAPTTRATASSATRTTSRRPRSGTWTLSRWRSRSLWRVAATWACGAWCACWRRVRRPRRRWTTLWTRPLTSSTCACPS
mmetsp:Transcript_33655/g.85206  ORF Transcript_33655/g.85206 Transcript_33655/m.85206 type:complete len:220 (+) Transcript_33655:1925-2584(+)